MQHHVREREQNLVHRLLRRECGGDALPAATANHARKLFENVQLTHLIPRIAPPHGVCFIRFTPCGRYLIAFDDHNNQVLLYSCQGWFGCLQDAEQSIEHAVPCIRIRSLRGTTSDLSDDPHSGPNASTFISFDTLFPLHARCALVRHHTERLLSVALVVRSRYLISATSWQGTYPNESVGSETGEHVVAPVPSLEGMESDVDPDGERSSIDWVTFHVISLESGEVTGRQHLRMQGINLAHYNCLSLYGDTLTVLGSIEQVLYVLKVTESGDIESCMAPLSLRGCRSDDVPVWQRQRDLERDSAPSRHESGANQSGDGTHTESSRRQPQLHHNQEASAADDVVEGGSDDAAVLEDEVSPTEDDGERIQEYMTPTPTPIEGLRHRLFVQLYLRALAESNAALREASQRLPQQEAHNKAVGGGGEVGEEGDKGNIPLPPQKRRRMENGGGESVLRGASDHQSPVFNTASPAVTEALRSPPARSLSAPLKAVSRSKMPPPRRHALQTFYYFFELYEACKMHSVRLIDAQRVLISWSLSALDHVMGAAAAADGSRIHTLPPAGFRGLQGVFNLSTLKFDAVFEHGTPAFARWCREHPAVWLAGGPATDWDRFFIPGLWGRQEDMAASRSSQSGAGTIGGSTRGTATTAGGGGGEFRLPTYGCQIIQSSPYLDKELFQFNDRLICREGLPRRLPNRTAKFVTRARPPRLSFEIDPNLVYAAAVEAGAAGGAHGSYEVMGLFHPSAPLMLGVVESVPTGTTEGLTLLFHAS